MSRKPRDRSVGKVVLVLLVVAVLVYLRNDRRNSSGPAGSEQVNGYDALTNCRLVSQRGNDGDSFRVQHGDQQFVVRLYYVDAPETYLSDRHESQRKRVQEQADDFGGISLEQAIATGKNARAHTQQLLSAKPFTVFTRRERVFDSERFYGFVQPAGSDTLLSESLVEQGLARIHTQGAETPSGELFFDFRDHLEELQRRAKAANRGGWAIDK